MASKLTSIQLRKVRVRKTLARRGNARPRLSIFRSSKNIYAQVIDDVKGVTVCSASTMEKDYKASGKKGTDKEAATAIGKLVAERAVSAGVKDVVFDRGGYMYHGRVKALAEAARASGLNF
jgi:large subunit ribosomal protein L18